MRIGFKDFRIHIGSRLGIADVYFSQTKDFYYADYRPNYPERTSADLLISYNHITEEAKLLGNLEAPIATIKEGTFKDILCLLDHFDSK